jgi:hypothetical protein
VGSWAIFASKIEPNGIKFFYLPLLSAICDIRRTGQV